MLEFGEDLFDGIEIGAVWGQEEQVCAGIADGLARGLAFVAAEIVEDDDIAWRKGGDKELLNVGAEPFAVDRAVEDTGRINAIDA